MGFTFIFPLYLVLLETLSQYVFSCTIQDGTYQDEMVVKLQRSSPLSVRNIHSVVLTIEFCIDLKMHLQDYLE